ncbi:CoA-transferase family III domain-containing protein [Mycena capillaripes]|nr:CoA-transferase family III domain-containing protein [Mycena capillaripes]
MTQISSISRARTSSCVKKLKLLPACGIFVLKVACANDLPLSGIHALELGQLIAGPFAEQLLGYVEAPKNGDPLRVWREVDLDSWSPSGFRSIDRNKKSVEIDLHTPHGRDQTCADLRSDVLIGNFEPGTLEKWSLDAASLNPHIPDLIYTRVSGYGQTGPWGSCPGFASVCEAESGFRFMNFSVTVAGLYAAFGTMLALLQRLTKEKGEEGGPRSLRLVCHRYRPDQRSPLPPPETPAYTVIGANGDSLYARLMHLIGAPHLAGPVYAQISSPS